MKNLAEKIESGNFAKTYATYEMAVKKAEEFSEKNSQSFCSNVDTDYIIVFLPIAKRFTPVFLLSKFLKESKCGGYVGGLANSGFYTI